jgi:NitT/TauT family transport system substrate-binding protein
MNREHAQYATRRQFLGRLTLMGTAGLLGIHSGPSAAEPPPETTRIRLVQNPGICLAPQYVAEELLRNEGFTDIQYLKQPNSSAINLALTSGEVDITGHFAGPAIIRVDAGDPIVILSGLHAGCFELFGTDRVRTVRDLKGKTAAALEPGSAEHVFLSSIATYVGLDPSKDINWVMHPAAESMQLLAEGKIDAFLGFPPQPQELRAKGIGHVVLNSSTDRPWAQYFCCTVLGNKEFVRKHPVATKRALRAILKTTDLCAREPERAARSLVDGGFAPRYDYALQTMREVPYNKWREYDPEDTIRFYALRLHEAGMVKNTPQKLIAQGTDWRFLSELKKELKA